METQTETKDTMSGTGIEGVCQSRCTTSILSRDCSFNHCMTLASPRDRSH